MRRIKRTRKHEKPLCTARAKYNMPGTLLAPEEISAGEPLEISKIVKTPAGIYCKLINTKRWVSDKDLHVSIPTKEISDFSKNSDVHKKFDNNSNKLQIRCKKRIRFVTNSMRSPNGGRLRRIKLMDKQTLKTVLTGLEPEDKFTVTFLGEKSDQSGEYTVVQTKKGRGKKGSTLVELMSPTGEVMTTGTPDSDLILHVVGPDGTMHGWASLTDVPPTFDTDTDKAKALKLAVQALFERCTLLPKDHERDTRCRYEPTETVELSVESTHEPLNGRFNLVGLQQLRGRYGQVRVTLMPTTGGEGVVLDTYQHSTVVTSFEEV